MIEVAIPKDILKYKATLIGPFTARQTICICVTGVLELVYYKAIKMLPMTFTMDAIVGFGFLFAMCIMAFGILEPFGMSLEEFLKNVVVLSILAPKQRVYKTKTLLDMDTPQRKKSKTRVFTSKELKLHPDYILYS